ncbi:hypothetical protein [Bacteroides cellulosilyticus]|jgi:hypothetical protein|uniref:hypothetical protein n=1 Tax=Bacteroides cellulosilyticus TaxID=246787 RepID=UPI002051F349|nr:MAG TPA: hypothetical protein [Caudoviricetes sp.]
MISNKNITATQASNTDLLLLAYRQFSGNNIAMADDLFVFLTAPTPERDVFLVTCCTCTISVSENILLLTYAPL